MLLVIVVVVPILSVRTVTVRLVLASAFLASLFVVAQTAMALVTIASAPGRRVSVGRAFELWFAGSLPHSTWILFLPILTLIPAGPLDVIVCTLLVPTIWTSFIAAAFCRNVLGDTPVRARWRTATHQLVTLTALTAYGLWAAGGVDSVRSYVQRVVGLR